MVGGLRVALVVASGFGLAACGESARIQESANAPASGTGGLGASGGSGSAGRGAGGVAASAGSGSTVGGAPQGGLGGAGGVAGIPLDPEVTRRYTWQECGRIPGDINAYEISSLDLDASGSLLVSNAGVATAWRVAEPFETSEALWSHGGEGAYNTDVSEDGRMVVVSGDLRLVYDSESGEQLPIEQHEFPGTIDIESICIFTEYRFSPEGRYVAGKHYDTRVEVFETAGWTRVAELETNGCGQGLSFFSDAIVTPEGSFSTTTWTPTSTLNPQGATRGLPAGCYVYLDPDQAQPTTCCNSGGCQTSLGDGNVLSGGKHPRFSSEGHWVVSAGTLLHLPSGDTRAFDPEATEALFAPNGDVIAGEQDGSLLRFCRSE